MSVIEPSRQRIIRSCRPAELGGPLARWALKARLASTAVDASISGAQQQMFGQGQDLYIHQIRCTPFKVVKKCTKVQMNDSAYQSHRKRFIEEAPIAAR